MINKGKQPVYQRARCMSRIPRWRKKGQSLGEGGEEWRRSEEKSGTKRSSNRENRGWSGMKVAPIVGLGQF